MPETSNFKPGLYAEMSAAAYFADPCPQPSLSQSIAKIILNQSPLHGWHAHPRLNPNKPSDEKDYDKARAIGNAAHKLMLGRGKDVEIVRMPERVKEKGKWVVPDPTRLVDADDMRTEAAHEDRDRIAAAGDVPILRKHRDIAEVIASAGRPQLNLAGCPEAFRDGNAEVVMAAYDAEHGIWLRSMSDWMVDLTLMYDLKTGQQSAAPHTIPRRMINDGWDVQAAMQERILDILYPDTQGKRRFRFVAVEDDEPYALTVNELLESVMGFGRRKLDRACRLFANCLRTNKWPAYPPFVHRPEAPGYAENAWLEREISDSANDRMPGWNGVSFDEKVPFNPALGDFLR